MQGHRVCVCVCVCVVLPGGRTNAHPLATSWQLWICIGQAQRTRGDFLFLSVSLQLISIFTRVFFLLSPITPISAEEEGGKVVRKTIPSSSFSRIDEFMTLSSFPPFFSFLFFFFFFREMRFHPSHKGTRRARTGGRGCTGTIFRCCKMRVTFVSLSPLVV